jgi:hypothetical protein
MESTTSRPAVDLETRRPRSGLALILALLSVPGSTLAWDLPAGGLWIGLPLGVAAIVLGIRSRRQLAGRGGTGMATAAIIIAALAVGSMVLWSVGALVS